jgi:hypothetical protein
MCEFTDAERRYLTEAGSLTRDQAGEKCWLALPDEESAALMAHRRRFSAGNTLPDTATLTPGSSWPKDTSSARP